jgi:hypothetical protein
MTDKEKAPYHKIMVDTWRLFIKDRIPQKFSNEWWEEIIKDYEELREPYKGDPLDDYVCHISQVFLDELERIMKRDRPKRLSKEVLPGTQGYPQAELQCSDSISKMGGSKEDNQTITAEDWG